jgi:hypothetical protein
MRNGDAFIAHRSDAGAIWKAPCEICAHAAVARKLGFSEEDISKLSGQSPESLSGAERIAQQYASQGRSQ